MQLMPRFIGKDKRLAEWAERNARWSSHTKFTPDYTRLAQHNWNVFLICDDMMKGRRAVDILAGKEDAFYIGVAYTQHNFTMFKRNLGLATYPVVLDPPDGTKGVISRSLRAPVRGELWAIKADRVIELDKHRLNTVEFSRRRVAVDIPYQTVTRYRDFDMVSEWFHHEGQRAWMYVGIHDLWYFMEMDKGFKPVKAFEPRGKGGEVFTERFNKNDHGKALAFFESVNAELKPSILYSNALEAWVVRYVRDEKSLFKPYYYYTMIEDAKA